MITKAQSKTVWEGLRVAAEPKLSGVEKSMLKWSVVEPDDRVLDCSVGNGLFGEYLRRNMLCEYCGVSDIMDSVRAARGRLQNCDIVYAAKEDIPWHDGAFDVVFARIDIFEPDSVQKSIDEMKRVLRDGGQLVLGINAWFGPAGRIVSALKEEAGFFQPSNVIRMLSEAGLEEPVWNRSGLHCGSVTAWKHKDGVPV